jgi:hypothetical protein
MISNLKAVLKPYSIVILDGYFMKKGFIEALRDEDFQIVAKGRGC